MKELEIINSGTDKFPFYQILDGTNEVAATHRLEIAKQLVDSFNTAQKCGLLPSELLRQRDELRERCKQLEFMIEKGLGWDDVKNDISMPHEL